MASRTKTTDTTTETLNADTLPTADAQEIAITVPSMADAPTLEMQEAPMRMDMQVRQMPTLTPLGVEPLPAAEAPPSYGSVFGFDDAGWKTNELVVTGVIAPPRPRRDGKKARPWSAPVRQTSDGGRYKVFQVDINERMGAAETAGEMVMTRLETLIPLTDPVVSHLEQHGGTISLRGRLAQTHYRDMREERRMQVVDGGVYLRRTESVIVSQIVLVDPLADHYAVGHVRGVVQRVLAVNAPLQYGDAQRYHTVTMRMTEQRPRRAPARGVEVLTTDINVLVPVEFPQADMLLRVGNPMAVEYGVKRVVIWLADQRLALVREEERDRARTRHRDEWIVSFIDPQPGAEAPDDAMLAAVTAAARERQQRRRHNAGARAKARLAQMQKAQDGSSPALAAPGPAPVETVKRRRVHPVAPGDGAAGYGAAGIPAMDLIELNGGV